MHQSDPESTLDASPVAAVRRKAVQPAMPLRVRRFSLLFAALALLAFGFACSHGGGGGGTGGGGINAANASEWDVLVWDVGTWK